MQNRNPIYRDVYVQGWIRPHPVSNLYFAFEEIRTKDIKSRNAGDLHKSWKLSDRNPIILHTLPFLAERAAKRKQEEKCLGTIQGNILSKNRMKKKQTHAIVKEEIFSREDGPGTRC